MPFSHHSHSGQFCGHAENTLREVVQIAIEKGMEVFAMTEHMPRDEEDFYPEEIKVHTALTLSKLFDDYYYEAVRLRQAFSPRIKLLVGVEVDWIRPSSKEFINALLNKYQFDLFIGSVHHVHTIPIDYDRKRYEDARERCGGTDERLFEDYFDHQFDMLKALKPPIVAHFDLIRLLSDKQNASMKRWNGVWKKVLRNLDFITDYGGIIELNSAALRKGMHEPYPQADICKEFLARGGQFTISDDSHGVSYVGTNYGRLLQFIEKLDVVSLTFLEKGCNTKDPRFPNVSSETVSIAQIRKHPVFA
ncbi:FK506 binding protein proline rotamase rapamycin-binding protein [Lecanora helva]